MRKNVLGALALASTTWILIASSNPNAPKPCQDNPPEVRTFRVTGSCGVEGFVEIRSSLTCSLTLDGGDALGLPPTGSQPFAGSMLANPLRLDGFVSLAPSDAGLADGGEFCADHACDYHRSCSGPFVDAGYFELICETPALGGIEHCEAHLAPVPRTP